MNSMLRFVVAFALILSWQAAASSPSSGPPRPASITTAPTAAIVTDRITITFLLTRSTSAPTTIAVQITRENGTGTPIPVPVTLFDENGTGTANATGQFTLDGKSGKNSQTLQFSQSGAYTVQVSALHNGFNNQASYELIVGPAIVINPVNDAGIEPTNSNGVQSTSREFPSGVVNIRSFLAGGRATNATVEFDDIPTRRATVTGLNTTHTYADSGLFVVTSTVTGTTSVPLGGSGGKVRKTVGISARDVNTSGSLNPPDSTEIEVKKASGKFLFTDTVKPDSVTVSGIIKLPAGFDPARADGNTISIGVGNVIDSIGVDSKGKPLAESAQKRVTKFKVKYPKVAEGTLTAGGELATITATYSIANLDTLGFDTEGITNSRAFSEFSAKSLTREIQFNVLIGGVTYAGRIPVSFKLSKPNKTTFVPDAGNIKLIPRRTAK